MKIELLKSINKFRVSFAKHVEGEIGIKEIAQAEDQVISDLKSSMQYPDEMWLGNVFIQKLRDHARNYCDFLDGDLDRNEREKRAKVFLEWVDLKANTKEPCGIKPALKNKLEEMGIVFSKYE